MLTLDKFYHAAYVLRDVIHKTPLIHAPGICPEADIYLKPENLQLTGSFKLRGAGYMISCLSDEEKQRGVIACSAGNHAQGVALAATKYHIKSLRRRCSCATRRAIPLSTPLTMRTSSPGRAPSGWKFYRSWTTPTPSSCPSAAAGFAPASLLRRSP